ncbi:MAG: dTMP kinase [Saprospiraceae bacterium]|nr:dTMP kinase [Saprospiraceae bacterium]MBP6237277.1 dTMP kinase [Saprospiraceae bacterium]MBP6568759.1 dTMP kinase [Saprospiraceae bacterium]
MSVKNLFIAFEGIDGSGKSTQVKLLAEFLTHKGHKVYTTFEPTDSRIGVMIRDIFNHRMEGDQRVIAALFAADRLNHLLNSQDGILKKLKEGYTVITDRYYFSSYAYHSVHNIDMDWVIQANSMSADLLRPDLNIYIDISPDVSMERLKKGRNSFEMYETLENQKMVYDKYKEAFDRLGDAEKVFVTDGNRKTDLIAEDIRIAVEALIGPGNN